MRRLSFWTALFVLLMLLTVRVAQAQQSPSPGQAAETIRSTLVQIQLRMRDDPAGARVRLDSIRTRYTTTLAPAIAAYAAQSDAHARAGFSLADQALVGGDEVAFAAARAQIWTAILAGGYQVVIGSLQAGEVEQAQQWLAVREFRHATRFSRPNADATRAIH